jgi:hypothetical protein
MSMKFQMTREGMQSMYTMAWTQRRARPSKFDPMFSGYGVDQSSEESDVELEAADAALLEEAVVNPRRAAPIEDSIRTASQRDRELSRRVLDLVRLGYTGF